MEAIYLHGPDVVSFNLVMGWERWHVVRCYIAPNNASTIEDIVVSIYRHPQGDELLMADDFNADLADPEGSAHVEDIAAELVSDGLEDISSHFLLICKSWSRYVHTWSNRHGDRVYNTGPIASWRRTVVCTISYRPRTRDTNPIITLCWGVSGGH